MCAERPNGHCWITERGGTTKPGVQCKKIEGRELRGIHGKANVMVNSTPHARKPMSGGSDHARHRSKPMDQGRETRGLGRRWLERRREGGEVKIPHHHAKQNAAPSKGRASMAARLSPLRGDATTRGAPVNEQYAKCVYAFEDAYMHLHEPLLNPPQLCSPPLFRSPLYNAEACDGLVESGMGATGTPPSMDSRGRDPMSMRLPEHGINRLFLL